MCLLAFFVSKPLLKRELENSNSFIELCGESEEKNEENKAKNEIEILESNLFSMFLLDELCLLTNRGFDCFISQYENRYIPIINTPPPQFV